MAPSKFMGQQAQSWLQKCTGLHVADVVFDPVRNWKCGLVALFEVHHLWDSRWLMTPICQRSAPVWLSAYCHKDFPGYSDGKQSACNVGYPGLIPGSGRSPEEGNDYPLHYSCLENSMDRGAWWATVHGVTKSRTRLRDKHTRIVIAFTQFQKLTGLLTFI